MHLVTLMSSHLVSLICSHHGARKGLTAPIAGFKIQLHGIQWSFSICFKVLLERSVLSLVPPCALVHWEMPTEEYQGAPCPRESALIAHQAQWDTEIEMKPHPRHTRKADMASTTVLKLCSLVFRTLQCCSFHVLWKTLGLGPNNSQSVFSFLDVKWSGLSL